MFNTPKTLEEAYKCKYRDWVGNPGGNPYDLKKCAYEVWPSPGYLSDQCSRKNGHGPAGLYCKQHAKMVEA